MGRQAPFAWDVKISIHSYLILIDFEWTSQKWRKVNQK